MRTSLGEIAVTLILAAVIFLLLQAAFQSSIVVGCSMEPSLQQGQRLLIIRNEVTIKNKVLYTFHEPERGDVIVFHPPNNPDPKATPFIKRIIALPNDTIEIKNGAVYISGKQLYEPYIKDPPNYTIHWQKITENNYFVLGDNRNSSNDSHNGWVVSRQDIIGKAWLSIWPPNKWGLVVNYPLHEQIASSMKQVIAWLELKGGEVDK